MRPLLAASLAALLFLAGCSGSDGAPSRPDEASQEAPAPEFSDTTGAIQGHVVDDALNPVAGAQVALKETGANATSDGSGAFTFSQLLPGRYTVLANALGYESAARAVDVEASAVAPVQIALAPLPFLEPYTDLKTFTGLIECAVGVTGNSANCLPLQFLFQMLGINPTNTRIIGLFPVTEPSKVVQGVFEMTWNPSTATTSGELLLSVELEFTGVVTGKTYASEQGRNPVKVVTGPEPFKDLDPAQNKTRVQTRTFPAMSNPPTVVVNQKFEVFATFCYVLECAPEYSAI